LPARGVGNRPRIATIEVQHLARLTAFALDTELFHILTFTLGTR
jgi:hypothetical protein